MKSAMVIRLGVRTGVKAMVIRDLKRNQTMKYPRRKQKSTKDLANSTRSIGPTHMRQLNVHQHQAIVIGLCIFWL
jgi:hypothetical protein